MSVWSYPYIAILILKYIIKECPYYLEEVFERLAEANQLLTSSFSKLKRTYFKNKNL